MKELVLTGFGVIAAFASGCAVDPKASVLCQGVGVGYQCEVTHEAGSAPLKVCWTLSVECKNGSKTSADACQAVAPESKASRVVTDFQNANACDLAVSVSVLNVAVTL